MYDSFKEALKYLRKKNGVTQTELGEYLGVVQSAVGNWERGRNIPSYELLVKIADYFNVSTDYLIGRTSDRQVIKRPISELAEKFARDYPDLLSDKRFMTSADLYSRLPDEYQERIFTYILGIATGFGIVTVSK